jgi:YfiH family protein
MTSKTLKINNKNGVCYITFPKLEKLGLVNHLFSTRLGGVSQGRYESMHLSFLNGDKRENVLENYRRLCGCVDIDINNLVLSAQTHTNNVEIVTKNDCGKGIFKDGFCDVDGLITNDSGVALVTQYADCTPLLFYDPVNRVVATSPSGWRGTVQQIGRRTVEVMTEKYGSRPEDIIAAVGPAIGRCCYEVDDPVINEIKKLSFLDFPRCYTEKDNGKYMLDLKEVNREILINAGLRHENIDVSELCTACNADLLHSHRKTAGKRGTLGAFIALK